MSHHIVPPGLTIPLAAAVLLLAGCAGSTGGNGEGGDAFTFIVEPVLNFPVGPVIYSFCDPMPTSNTDACGPFPETANPTGGQPPYHFQLGSGTGFPPPGVTLGKDGLLTGTIPPSSAGRSYAINVCAVDVSADAVCHDVELVVGAAPTCPGDAFAGTVWDGTFRIYSGQNVRYTAPFDFRFADPVYYDWGGCLVPIEEASVDDPAHPWVMDADAMGSTEDIGLACDEETCDTFHLFFGMPDGPGVEEVGGGTALRMDASGGGFGDSVIAENEMIGSAGTGGYGGGCCWPGDFDAAPRGE